MSGLLVPASDAAALAAAIDALLADPGLARRIGQAGRKRITESFSLRGMARATERLYRSLLEGRRFEEEGGAESALQREAI